MYGSTTLNRGEAKLGVKRHSERRQARRIPRSAANHRDSSALRASPSPGIWVTQ